MLLEVVEIVGYHLPGIGLQTGLLEELAVAGGIALQLLNLSQQGTVVTIGIPEKDSVVVKHVGFRVFARSPVDGNAARTNGVEHLLCDVALLRGILRADVELILFKEFCLVVVEPDFEF